MFFRSHSMYYVFMYLPVFVKVTDMLFYCFVSVFFVSVIYCLIIWFWCSVTKLTNGLLDQVQSASSHSVNVGRKLKNWRNKPKNSVNEEILYFVRGVGTNFEFVCLCAKFIVYVHVVHVVLELWHKLYKAFYSH